MCWRYGVMGMVLAQSCGLTSVAALLADLLGSSLSDAAPTVATMVRPCPDKKGAHRQRSGCDAVFCPLVVLDCEPVACQRVSLGFSDGFTTLFRRLHRTLH